MSFQGTYDPALNFVSFMGVDLTSGYGKDTFIKIERSTDAYTLAKGVSGEGARAKSNDRSGTVEITLLATSLANTSLAALAKGDELNSDAVGALSIKELNGTMVASATHAWIKKHPVVERGKEVGESVWVFECDDLTVFSGGLL